MNTIKNKQVIATLDSLHEKAAADRRHRQEQRQKAVEQGEVLTLDWANAYLAIGPEEGEFIHFLASVAKAKNIVEFGCSFGISTIYLADAARNQGGKVITTDLESTKVAGAKRNLQEAGLSDWVEIRQGDAMQTLDAVEGDVDFLFLDGAKDLYLPIFEKLRSKLPPGSLIIADNADHAGTQSFIKYILAHETEFSALYLFEGRIFVVRVL